MRLLVLSLLAAAATPTATPPTPAKQPPGSPSEMAGMNHGDIAVPSSPQIMSGYGGGGFRITTRVPAAQAFFDNGMQLAHAFAHKAAIAAMSEAVRRDPACAMCLWGLAWASGPTINYGKEPGEIAELAKLVDKATGLAAARGTDGERALIHALQLRYRDGGGGKPGDLDFAKAMTALSLAAPDNDELAVMSADAWLMTKAESAEDWKLNAGLAMPLLERVLARSPDYTPAIHFYIHASEIAGVPGKAERYADRLQALAPRASHLVHMPSHTYYWVGRYQDAADANMRAVELGIENARRLGLGPPDGVWGLPYHVHNVSFGLGGALQAGDAKIALALGRPLVERSQRQATAPIYLQMVAAHGYFAMARFADPAEVLALPRPTLPLLLSEWHYARGEALARQGNSAGVTREAAAIEGFAKASRDDGTFAAQSLTMIARDVLVGRAAMLDRKFAAAATAFRAGAELQESDDFSAMADPPAWYYPVRRDLAAALLAGGDPVAARREAEATLSYRKLDPPTVALLAAMPSAGTALEATVKGPPPPKQ